MSRRHRRPFFLAVGIFRPHSPHFAPTRFFRQYPLDKLALPMTPTNDEANDADDIPAGGQALLRRDRWMDSFAPEGSIGSGTLKSAVQAYQASASFADEQIGRVLDALWRRPDARNTVIVLWSDHGFQLGEKRKWEKFTLWEKATHVPFIVVAPGVARAGIECGRPVSLLDIYPTLIELCGLAPKPELEGRSLVPLLKNPRAGRIAPAVMTFEQGNHAVRSERWRYIRYADGGEELYDHRRDEREWRNLAGEPKYKQIIDEHRRWLPERDAAPVADLKP